VIMKSILRMLIGFSTLLLTTSCWMLPDSNGDYLIHRAVRTQDFAEVKKLVEENWRLVCQVNDRGTPPIFIATETGNLGIFNYLEKHGADIFKTYHGRTLINVAAYNGSYDIVKYLLDKGISTAKIDTFGDTPLFRAVEGDKIKVAKLLLRQGAKVNTECSSGQYPIHEVRSPEMVDLLIKHGADPNQHTGKTFGSFSKKTPLHYARGKGTAKALIKAGGKLEAKDINGNTPLMRKISMASWSRQNVDDINELIDLGADVKTRNNENQTPLHYATQAGVDKIIKKLIEKGANPDAISNYNMTPLHGAAAKGRTLCVKALLEKGANPNILTTGQRPATALDIAEMYNYQYIIKLLKKYGGLRGVAVSQSKNPSALKKVKKQEN